MIEVNNSLEEFNNKFDQEEESISELKVHWKLSNKRGKEVIVEEWKKKNEESLKDLWDTIKLTNMCIMRIPEVEERKDQKAYLNK